jgi:hypothetical protein
MRKGSAYKHLFSIEGTHHWKDPATGAIKGTVLVETPRPQAHETIESYQLRWTQMLKEAAKYFEIEDNMVKPESLTVAPGESVFWTIGTNPGGVAVVLDAYEPPKKGAGLQDIVELFYDGTEKRTAPD